MWYSSLYFANSSSKSTTGALVGFGGSVGGGVWAGDGVGVAVEVSDGDGFSVGVLVGFGDAVAVGVMVGAIVGSGVIFSENEMVSAAKTVDDSAIAILVTSFASWVFGVVCGGGNSSEYTRPCELTIDRTVNANVTNSISIYVAYHETSVKGKA